MRKWAFRLLLILCVVVGAWYAQAWFRSTAPLQIRETPLTSGPLALTITATGRLTPTTEVTVGCEVSGTLQEVLVSYNDLVKRGQVIARLKPELYAAEHEQAKADHARLLAELAQLEVSEREAQREYARVLRLVEEHAATQEERDVRKAAVDAAAAATAAGRAAIQGAASRCDLAKYRFDRTTITSPIDGIVLDRSVDVGQTVAAALHSPVLFVLAEDLAHMRLLADVSEADVGYICVGQKARFTVNAYRDRVFEGTVRQIRNQSRAVTNVVTYAVVIDVDNADRLLRPGMPTDVTIEIVRREQAVKIANAALRFRPPLPPDDVRRILEGLIWPAEPPPIEVVSSTLTADRPADAVIPPPIKPVKAALWQYRNGSFKPVPVWTLITDNKETLISPGPEVTDGAAFVSEVISQTTAQNPLQKMIMLTRPENRSF